jgi:hypothetical protein
MTKGRTFVHQRLDTIISEQEESKNNLPTNSTPSFIKHPEKHPETLDESAIEEKVREFFKN